MRRKLALVIMVVCICGASLWTYRSMRSPRKVLAQNGDWVSNSLLDTSYGGMAQYGSAVLNSGSASADLQAVTNWNTYINARCNWSLSSSDLSRLANADYNARQAGPATITAQQLANAATSIGNAVLATMSASQQQALFKANTSISVPNGQYWMNAPDPNVSATENGNGTWTITVSPNEFAQAKTFFQTYAPSMVSSGPNFYPGEAMMITYSLASGDLGYDNNYISNEIQMAEQATGLYVQQLYGANGYLLRRPLGTFLTESNISQFFSDLGF